MNDRYWLLLATQALIFAVIFLSYTVITGMAGQISLCQVTFAAIGAFATAQLVARATTCPVMLDDRHRRACVAAIVGAAARDPGAPARRHLPRARDVRVRARCSRASSCPSAGSVAARRRCRSRGPVIGPVDFTSNRSFFFLCLAVLIIVSVLVILVRSGATGRFLDALRGSETAAQSIGINPTRARDRGVRALGRDRRPRRRAARRQTRARRSRPTTRTSTRSSSWCSSSPSVPARSRVRSTPRSASSLLQEILKRIGVSASWEPILFGLGAITYARNPEGILEAQKRRSNAFVQRQLDRFKQRPRRSRHRPSRAAT